MASRIHIHLMYAPSAEAPERFFELRRHGHQVWTAEGGIYTFGEDQLIDCDDAADAKAAAAEILAHKSAHGFVPARSFAYAADSFDYAAFTTEVARGLAAFWRNLGAQHPSLEFGRLALSTDDDAMTISAYAHAPSPDDEDYVAYNPQEWPHLVEYELEIAYRLLLAKHRDIPFEPMPANYTDNILECMIRAMEQVRAASLIGDNVMMWVDISDSGQVAGMFERLNSTTLAADLANHFGEDADLRLDTTI